MAGSSRGVFAIWLALAGVACRAAEAPPDPVMGDYQGERIGPAGEKSAWEAQVICLGDDSYQAVLAASFPERPDPVVVLEGRREAGRVVFPEGVASPGWSGAIDGPVFRGQAGDPSAGPFKLIKTERRSPALGATPPEGALVLFAGDALDAWEHPGGAEGTPARWALLGDGAMEITPGSGGSLRTRQRFSDFQLHLEFRLPFQPAARGQGRGNSGVYILERYELQILDSYGLEGAKNECGAIYKFAAPRRNLCAPPLQWQTYDITFRAPRVDAEGQKQENARITVRHNGVTVHDDLELPGPTGAAARKPEIPAGHILLQDHGNPVRFRNIWLVEG